MPRRYARYFDYAWRFIPRRRLLFRYASASHFMPDVHARHIIPYLPPCLLFSLVPCLPLLLAAQRLRRRLSRAVTPAIFAFPAVA